MKTLRGCLVGLLALLAFLAGLIVGLSAAIAEPAPSCRFPIIQERPKWEAQGLTVAEIKNPKLFLAEFESAVGETTEADRIFALTVKDAPNVILVFVVKGCASTTAILPKAEYRLIRDGMPA